MMQFHVNGDPGQVIRLHKPTYLIGRSSICNLRFPDTDLELVHARLRVKEHAVSVSGQDNAEIEINGSPLTGEVALTHGDELRLGAVTLNLVDTGQADESGPLERSQAGQRAQPRPDHSQREPDETASPAGWVLQGLNAGFGAKRFVVEEAAVLGRGKDCDIRLGDSHLSRRHARLRVTDEGLEVEDLDSANGTFVNGRRVMAAILQSGDELSFDTLKFRVIHLKPSAEADETIADGNLGEARQPLRPAGPTAIDIQRATLRRMRDERPGEHAFARHNHSSLVASGWLALATMAVLLAGGVLWGATSFFDTPFSGQ